VKRTEPAYRVSIVNAGGIRCGNIQYGSYWTDLSCEIDDHNQTMKITYTTTTKHHYKYTDLLRKQ